MFAPPFQTQQGEVRSRQEVTDSAYSLDMRRFDLTRPSENADFLRASAGGLSQQVTHDAARTVESNMILRALERTVSTVLPLSGGAGAFTSGHRGVSAAEIAEAIYAAADNLTASKLDSLGGRGNGAALGAISQQYTRDNAFNAASGIAARLESEIRAAERRGQEPASARGLVQPQERRPLQPQEHRPAQARDAAYDPRRSDDFSLDQYSFPRFRDRISPEEAAGLLIGAEMISVGAGLIHGPSEAERLRIKQERLGDASRGILTADDQLQRLNAQFLTLRDPKMRYAIGEIMEHLQRERQEYFERLLAAQALS